MSQVEENDQEDEKLSRELEILARQQEADSEDEAYLSDSAQVVDANDLSVNTRESLDLNLNDLNQKIWLVRLPRFLAAKLKDKSHLKGQEIGKIKVENVVNGSKKPSMKMQLNEDPVMSFDDIPHEYELQLTKDIVQNQYVFREENLSNFNNDDDNLDKTELDFNSKIPVITKQDADADSVNSSSISTPNPAASTDTNSQAVTSFTLHANDQQPGSYQRNNNQSVNGVKKKRRFNKFQNRDGSQKLIPFVKTIPKKTAIMGKIVHECQAVPSINDPKYSKIIEERKKLIREEPRPTVTLLNEKSGVTFSNTGLTLKSDTSSFLKTQVVKNKSEGRAIRMPQKDLFDILFKLFDEYDYWSLKGIKERTKQPEVYLKETLEQIAILIKKGPYALRYALKREYKELKDQERAAKLGELGLNDDENEDDDDDNEDENEDDIEMEDVV